MEQLVDHNKHAPKGERVVWGKEDMIKTHKLRSYVELELYVPIPIEIMFLNNSVERYLYIYIYIGSSFP
jgi:hypothetical protein